MIRRIACVAVIGLILSIITVNAESSEKEKAAVFSAEKWLGIIDEGKYSESWKETADLFRNVVL